MNFIISTMFLISVFLYAMSVTGCSTKKNVNSSYGNSSSQHQIKEAKEALDNIDK